MTIKKRLARSNIAMFVIPVLAAAVLLLIGLGIGFLLLKQVYLPQLGISLQELHQTGEQIEKMLHDSAAILCIYAGAVAMTLLLTIAWTNLYLIRSLFRHISQPLDTLTAGVLTADPEQRLIFKNGAALSLKNKEYELLLFLMRHPGQVFSQEDLYEMIWGLESMGDNVTVAVHINRLREKVEDDPAHPKLLQTVWGVGYRLSRDA